MIRRNRNNEQLFRPLSVTVAQLTYDQRVPDGSVVGVRIPQGVPILDTGSRLAAIPPALGAGYRGFESHFPDQDYNYVLYYSLLSNYRTRR